MTEKELEKKMADLCKEYATSQGFKASSFDFGASIYPDTITCCLVVKDMSKDWDNVKSILMGRFAPSCRCIYNSYNTETYPYRRCFNWIETEDCKMYHEYTKK